MTHASVPVEVRQKLGISDNFIRLSVGIESVEDIMDDLHQALETACKTVWFQLYIAVWIHISSRKINWIQLTIDIEKAFIINNKKNLVFSYNDLSYFPLIHNVILIKT